MRKTLSWLTALATLLVASMVFAAKTKGVVIVAEGADTDVVRGDLAQSMPSGLAVQDATDLTAALAAQGVNGSLADALSTPKGRKQTLTGVKKALPQAGVAGVLSARSKKGKGGGREVRLVLILRSQLEPVIEENIVLAKGENAKQKYSPLLGAPLQDIQRWQRRACSRRGPQGRQVRQGRQGRAQGRSYGLVRHLEPRERQRPAPRSAATSTSPTPCSWSTRAAKRGCATSSTAVRWPARSALMPLPAWPCGPSAPSFIPGATSGIAYAKDIGLVGHFGMALPWASKTRDGADSVNGTWQRYGVGLRGRIKAGDGSDAPLIGLEATYNDFKFAFTGSDPVVSDVPAVDYKFIRPAADIRVPFGALSLLAGAGYMQILSSGPFGTKFPHQTIAGVDGHIGGSYALMPWLAGKITAQYVRVFSTAHSLPSDDVTAGMGKAGGALDQYLLLHLGVSAIF